MATKRDFTPQFIESARGKNGRRVETRDSKSPLCLRHSPAGRQFFVRVRIADGEQIRVTYPKCVAADAVKEARTWARSVVDQAKAGIDPKQAIADALA